MKEYILDDICDKCQKKILQNIFSIKITRIDDIFVCKHLAIEYYNLENNNLKNNCIKKIKIKKLIKNV